MSSKSKTTPPGKKLRIGFIHPDLGIGGAERLVVDAAIALQELGHNVTMFTSRHDPKRCFEETRDGTLTVHVLGSSLPRSFFGAFQILSSILRQLLLTFLLLLSIALPGPNSTPISPLSPLPAFDVFVVDQLSVCVPLLRWAGGTRVVFYCHFPDKLLSGGWEVEAEASGKGKRDGAEVRRKAGKAGGGLLKRMYRWPIDRLEEVTTGQSDVILANSQFTARVYARAFPSLKEEPKVVYPCIKLDMYKESVKHVEKLEDVKVLRSDKQTLISLNRFEAKKNVGLAIEAFAKLESDGLISDTKFSKLRLVIAGGYDDQLQDNIETHAALQSLCNDLNLSHHTLRAPFSQAPPPNTQIVFLLNFSTAQRTYLLRSPSTIALLYTPRNEHFGIVPIEAMACGLPVLAANSGGPVETIVEMGGEKQGTGLLRSPTPEAWSPALAALIDLTPSARAEVAEAAKRRVKEQFSSEKLGRELQAACETASNMGPLSELLADKLIWGGLLLMFSAAVGFFAIVIMYGDRL